MIERFRSITFEVSRGTPPVTFFAFKFNRQSNIELSSLYNTHSLSLAFAFGYPEQLSKIAPLKIVEAYLT